MSEIKFETTREKVEDYITILCTHASNINLKTIERKPISNLVWRLLLNSSPYKYIKPIFQNNINCKISYDGYKIFDSELNGFGFDSLDKVEVLMEFEKIFGVSISDDVWMEENAV